MGNIVHHVKQHHTVRHHDRQGNWRLQNILGGLPTWYNNGQIPIEINCNSTVLNIDNKYKQYKQVTSVIILIRSHQDNAKGTHWCDLEIGEQ